VVFSSHPLPRRRLLLAGLASASALLVVTACSRPQQTPDATGGTGAPQELLLVSYAVTRSAYDRILPKFEEQWKAKTGQDIKIKASYGGSGSQTRAIIDGLDADVAALALTADHIKLEEVGKLNPGWETKLPNNSIITNSTVAFITRPGNPKGIKTWSDLANPDITVITANPKTSGGARWNFLGIWGSVTETGGTAEQAERFVADVYKNVENLPKDAREASDVFLKRAQGDVLLNYENEALLATKKGELTEPFTVPEVNIRIEGPVSVVDEVVDRRGSREAATALAEYLFTEEAQEIFAEAGFRPVNPTVLEKTEDNFAPVKQLFTVQAFGGWRDINKTFFGDGGIWDRLFSQGR
jgi:sulfate/thiosulfate transport system substrate-binding protein